MFISLSFSITAAATKIKYQMKRYISCKYCVSKIVNVNEALFSMQFCKNKERKKIMKKRCNSVRQLSRDLQKVKRFLFVFFISDALIPDDGEI